LTTTWLRAGLFERSLTVPFLGAWVISHYFTPALRKNITFGQLTVRFKSNNRGFPWWVDTQAYNQLWRTPFCRIYNWIGLSFSSHTYWTAGSWQRVVPWGRGLSAHFQLNEINISLGLFPQSR
jgi:hypothetical protein